MDVDGKEFLSSEHYYQWVKFIAHDKTEKVEKLLLEENPFKAMQLAQQVIPNNDLLDEQKNKESKVAMSYANAVKFCSCSYAMEVLLNSKPLIAEATGDREWGSGLHLEATKECLSQFWPGKNKMGEILMELHAMFREEQTLVDRAKKRKAESPLGGSEKHSDVRDGSASNVDISHH